jgi:hypothetical protein
MKIESQTYCHLPIRNSFNITICGQQHKPHQLVCNEELLPINNGIAMFVSGLVDFIKVLLVSMWSRPGNRVVSQLLVTIFWNVIKQQNHATRDFGF